MSANILIVDDDADARTTLMRVLEKEGYSVTGAGSGNEALDCFDRSPFALVITDIRMEGMDGIELLRLLKSRRAEVCPRSTAKSIAKPRSNPPTIDATQK